MPPASSIRRRPRGRQPPAIAPPSQPTTHFTPLCRSRRPHSLSLTLLPSISLSRAHRVPPAASLPPTPDQPAVPTHPDSLYLFKWSHGQRLGRRARLIHFSSRPRQRPSSLLELDSSPPVSKSLQSLFHRVRHSIAHISEKNSSSLHVYRGVAIASPPSIHCHVLTSAPPLVVVPCPVSGWPCGAVHRDHLRVEHLMTRSPGLPRPPACHQCAAPSGIARPQPAP